MLKYILITIIALFLWYVSISFADTSNAYILQKAKHAWLIEHKSNLSLKPYIVIIDFTQADNKNRMFILDLKTNKIVYKGLVAHGKNSGNQYVTSVSNRNGSKKSSIGVMLSMATYYGHNGLSLRLKGLESGINNNIMKRLIVLHGSKYVNSSYVGHSWGCFAVPSSQIKNIIHIIGNNTMFFVYYPDQNWLKHSRFLNG